MKHQKFVKQLMARGYTRNEANVQAFVCREMGVPYKVYLSRCEFKWQVEEQLNHLRASFAGIAEALTPAIENLARTITACFSAGGGRA